MQKKLDILIVSRTGWSRARMGAGFFRRLAPQKVRVVCAGLTAETGSRAVEEFMKSAGLHISKDSPRVLGDLNHQVFDVVVTVGKRASDEYQRQSRLSGGGKDGEKDVCTSLFISLPVRIHWDIDAIRGTGRNTGGEITRVGDLIREHVAASLERGFLDALSEARVRQLRILDAMAEGIVMHGPARHLYVFNRAAEAITGLSRDQVLGRDCHDVFPPHGLCGRQCSFDDGPSAASHRTDYAVNFTRLDGRERKLRMHVKPLDLGDAGSGGIVATIRDVTEISDLRSQVRSGQVYRGMVGISPAMQGVFETIRQVSRSDYPVLITGESGTGKELVARATHEESGRGSRPFVPINCGALPESILESELFGHVRGAFTGAIRDKKGRFELADRGTLFLDEVGELSQQIQVKLLRVLQEKCFEPVGGERSIRVDVRIVSATNRGLRQLIRDGRFREDLFYRLCVVPIQLPPLRERREDIPFLVNRILGGIREETGKPIESVSAGAMKSLSAYRWPGNVRELINALQFASIRCSGKLIRRHHLPPEVLDETSGPGADRTVYAADPESGRNLRGRKRKLDRDAVRRALTEARGNRSRAARQLAVGRATLYRFLRENPSVADEADRERQSGPGE